MGRCPRSRNARTSSWSRCRPTRAPHTGSEAAAPLFSGLRPRVSTGVARLCRGHAILATDQLEVWQSRVFALVRMKFSFPSSRNAGVSGGTHWQANRRLVAAAGIAIGVLLWLVLFYRLVRLPDAVRFYLGIVGLVFEAAARCPCCAGRTTNRPARESPFAMALGLAVTPAGLVCGHPGWRGVTPWPLWRSRRREPSLASG